MLLTDGLIENFFPQQLTPHHLALTKNTSLSNKSIKTITLYNILVINISEVFRVYITIPQTWLGKLLMRQSGLFFNCTIFQSITVYPLANEASREVANLILHIPKNKKQFQERFTSLAARAILVSLFSPF